MSEMITDYRLITTRDGLARLTGDKDGAIIGKTRAQCLRMLAAREAKRERAGEPTPLSDEAIAAWEDWADALEYEYQEDPLWLEFRKLVTAKMERGKTEYGDASLSLAADEIMASAAEEPVDVVGWTALLIPALGDDASIGRRIASLHRRAFVLWKEIVDESLREDADAEEDESSGEVLAAEDGPPGVAVPAEEHRAGRRRGRGKVGSR